MTTNTLIESFESERERIRTKIAELNEREEFLLKAIAEIRRAAPGGKTRGPAKKKATRRKSGGRGRSRGGMTVKEAVLKVVGDAKEPVSPAEIIPATVQLSGGAEASIRTQLNNLSRSGDLKQVPHEGRGYKYTIGGGAAAPAKKKSAAKKKTGGKKKTSGKKKTAAKKKAAGKKKKGARAAASKAKVETAPAATPPAASSPEA